MMYALLITALSSLATAASAPVAVPLVVVDPGHGGDQTGAIGPCQLKEKDLTLEISTRLARILHTSGKVKVLLTRTTDRDVQLRRRVELANKVNANLFLSIHANASKDTSRHGVETYFLSHRSSNRRIARTMLRENRGVHSLPRKKTSAINHILAKMEQNSSHRESQKAAIHFEHQIQKSLKIKGRGVFQAPFLVLLKARMPAVLIEMGFITHTRECRKFKQDEYQEQMARAIASSVLSYLSTTESTRKATASNNNY